jgi:DNA-binding SARP family transcriptional activator
LALLRDGVPIDGGAAQRKRVALLAFLAAEGRQGVSRDRVVAYLWSESDEERALNALSQSLHVLRRHLGASAIVSTSADEMRIDFDVVASDVEAFRRATERGDDETAAALYAGSFLDGVFLRDAPEFERWVETKLSSFASDVRRALERLASAADARADHPSARRRARLRCPYCLS